MGMEAVALTDHGVMYGAIEFYKECKKQGIKPIIGLEAYVAPDSHTTRGGDAERYYHLTLLAKNLTGYKNLVKLTTIAHLHGFYYKPRIDKKLLEEYHEGLIALSGCLHGEIARQIVAHKEKEARETAQYFKNLFGAANYFFEVQDHPKLEAQKKVNETIKQLSKETGIAVVATSDSHYLNPDDAEAQDVMLCVQMGKTVDDPNRLDMRDTNVSLRSPDDMIEAFRDLPEAVANTVKVAEMCNVELELGKWSFPYFSLPEGKTADDFLKELAYKGLAEKYKATPPNPPLSKGGGEGGMRSICERLDYELDVISKKGFSPYFLIVADYVNWAREQGIICATRGSAAGSFVSYCIGITTENPLKFHLPFERFLNPSRPSPPDIDMDFADDRRDEVLAYVRQKYGQNKVAQICTFGAMMARAAVRDVTRALGLPYNLGDRIAKMIPFGLHGFHMTLNEAMRQNQELKDFYDRDADARRTIDMARKLEGSVRHASVHAAGVVIAPTEITDFVPLQLEPGGKNIITQYDMHACEDVGLVKMDFLGVRNLSILGLARDLVKQIKGASVDLENLGHEDKVTYELLARGETMGVFQLSSSGMTKHLKELKPSNIFDIMAMVALYRPGPINSIPEFIRRKHNPKSITYLDPRLEEILAKSYGVLTFQDDVLLIAIKLAGYTWEEADKLRKAMGKKIPAEMAKQKEKFIKGCLKNNLPELKAETLWQLIEPFAAYGFNLAHAASYATIAYQTAYMKAHYPTEYMTAILTAESGDIPKIAEAVVECRRLGIEVLPPAVNASREAFTYIDDQHIRFGLLAIKNIGTDIVKSIIEERETRGTYQSLEDFLTRVPSKNLNKKSLEAFIMSGALDEFGERQTLLDNIEKILSFRRDLVERKDDTQGNLFAAIAAGFAKPKLKLATGKSTERLEKMKWEKELLGLYLSDHPFRDYESLLPTDARRLINLSEVGEGAACLVAGIISHVHKIFTRKGEPMYFIGCDDGTAQIELVVFPGLAKQVNHLFVEGAPIQARGKVSTKENEVKVLADDIVKLKVQIQSTSGTLEIRVPNLENKDQLQELKKVLSAEPGNNTVWLVVNDTNTPRRIETSLKINYSDFMMGKLEALIGKDNVSWRSY